MSYPWHVHGDNELYCIYCSRRWRPASDQEDLPNGMFTLHNVHEADAPERYHDADCRYLLGTTGQTPLIDLENPPDWTRSEWFLDCPNTPHIDTPLHHGRLMLAAEFVTCVLMADETVRNVADFGAGDGGLLEQIWEGNGDPPIDIWGYDLAQPSIDYAKSIRGVDIENLDVINTEPRWPDLMIVTEFLEHLVDPFTFLRRAKEGGVAWVVASSPYTETLEYHYDLHTWAFTLEGYASLLADAGFEVVNQDTVDMFQVVSAVSKG